MGSTQPVKCADVKITHKVEATQITCNITVARENDRYGAQPIPTPVFWFLPSGVERNQFCH
jgi:hypothetical protein